MEKVYSEYIYGKWKTHHMQRLLNKIFMHWLNQYHIHPVLPDVCVCVPVVHCVCKSIKLYLKRNDNNCILLYECQGELSRDYLTKMLLAHSNVCYF